MDNTDRSIADGLFAIADAIRYAADHLGTGNAATQMGAIEALASKVGDAGDRIAMALETRDV